MTSKKLRALTILFVWFILLAALGVGLHLVSAHQSPPPSIQDQPAVISAPDLPPEIELIGHIGETASAIEVNEKYIAATYTGGFELISIADPSHPRDVSYLTIPHYFVHDIALDEDYAYITYGWSDGFGNDVGGLYIIDISDPTAPVLVKDIHTDVIHYHVAIHDHYAYVTSLGLKIFDVSNPTSPVEVGFLSDVYFDLAFEILQEVSPGNHVYAFAGSGSVLTILDLTNPTQPEVIGTLTTSSSTVRDIAVHTQFYDQTGKIYLYLTKYAYDNETAGIELVDATDPSAPVYIMTYDPDTNYSDIEINGTYAYVTSLQEIKQGPHILDISDPLATQEIFFYTSTQNITDLTVMGKYLYISDFVSGLHILDISEPSNPITTAIKDIMGHVALISGHYAYGTISAYDLDSGLQVWDLLNPVAPIQVEVLPFFGRCIAAVASGNYALFGEYGGDVRLFDISNPQLPVEVSIINYRECCSLWGPSAIAVKGEIGSSDEKAYAYITHYESGGFPTPFEGSIVIFDLSDPLEPSWSGHYGLPWAPVAISISDPYAFIAVDSGYAQGSYLAVLDISVVEPTLVTTTTMNSRVWDMSIFNDYAYLVLTDGLSIFDISDPASPVEVGRYVYQGGGSEIVIREGYAYLSGSSLIVLDISDPAHPQEVARQIPGGSLGLVLSGDMIYASDGEGGISIYQHATDTGRVRDVNGRPFSGVTLAVDDQTAAASGLTGSYDISDAPAGMHTLSPAMHGLAFWPPDRTVELTEFTQGQDFTALPQPISITLSASLTTTLLYTDTSFLPTKLEFPPVPLPGNLTLVLTPSLSAGFGEMIPTGHAFDIILYQDGSPLPGFSFPSPVQATIYYSRLNVRYIGDQSALGLYWWDESAWVDATVTCSTSTSTYIDIENRSVDVSFCQTGDFSLFGPTNHKYLPLINR